ncbi:hypothetical protein C9374_004991 [Naegleria lovaniensis]|uniref:Clathrin light chain n=1 Tax=Naegleria lovaniensis TaxID=51637 RepID=A0AA88GLA2_NAELO|nr:uncharacterized protein C9374_004991 [Naegleria lovaniensis]KAG2383024.1 hypothetical protein C9374_004991 [Naegleria lovaniensis]
MSDEDFFTSSDSFATNPNDNNNTADDMFGDQQQPSSFDEQNNDGFGEPQGDFSSFQNEDSYQEAPVVDNGFASSEPVAESLPQQKQLTAIREYEEKRYTALIEKDKESEQHHKKIVEDAKVYKQKWLKDREDRKDSNLKKNREDEEIFRSTMETVHDNVWENVMKYVDLNKAKSQNKLDKELDDMDDQILKKKKKKNQKEEEEKKPVQKKLDLDLEIEQKDTTRLRKILLELKAEAPAH